MAPKGQKMVSTKKLQTITVIGILVLILESAMTFRNLGNTYEHYGKVSQYETFKTVFHRSDPLLVSSRTRLGFFAEGESEIASETFRIKFTGERKNFRSDGIVQVRTYKKKKK